MHWSARNSRAGRKLLVALAFFSCSAYSLNSHAQQFPQATERLVDSSGTPSWPPIGPATNHGTVFRFRSDSLEPPEQDQADQDPAATQSQSSEALLARLEKLEAKLKEPAPTTYPNLKVNGVFQADGVLFNQTLNSRDAFGSVENGADFRRARLSAKGDVAENMSYFMQMDFGFFGRPTFTDLWVDLKQIPVLGNFRIGQWKQPFGLEVVSSFRYTTFMERSSLFQAFTPFRHIGMGFYDHADDLCSTWAISYFRTGQDQFGGSLSSDGGNGMAGRITRVLGYNEACPNHYCHVGAGYYLNSPPRDTARFRSIPEMFVGEFAPGGVGTSGQAVPGVLNGTPFFVDTLAIGGVSSIHTFGLETLWVRGPFSLQSEAMTAIVDRSAGNNPNFSGAYSQIGYFLTGEHRPYDRQAGAIDRVQPFCPFKPGGGWGAWELTCRGSFLDLTDKEIVGGQMTNLTAGLNWYVNPYCKWVFNYVHSWTQTRDYFPVVTDTVLRAQTDIFAFRCQIDF